MRYRVARATTCLSPGRRRATAASTGRNPARPRNAVPGPDRVHPTVHGNRHSPARRLRHAPRPFDALRYLADRRARFSRERARPLRPCARAQDLRASGAPCASRSSLTLRGCAGSPATQPGRRVEERGGDAAVARLAPTRKAEFDLLKQGARRRWRRETRGAPRPASAAPQSAPRFRRTPGNARGARILLAALHPTRVVQRELVLVRCVTNAALIDPGAARAGESE